jgi:hypothetical protein
MGPRGVCTRGLVDVDGGAHRHHGVQLGDDADSILILGPGEAKTELEARLGKAALGERIVGVETVDKMTDRRIAARVRERFAT